MPPESTTHTHAPLRSQTNQLHASYLCAIILPSFRSIPRGGPLLRRFLLLIAVLSFLGPPLPAQVPSSPATEITAWPDGHAKLDHGWRMRSGDDPAWAQPNYDDSSWKAVSLPARQNPPFGFVWYRLHLRLPADRPAMGLYLSLPENAYEVFVNGRPAGDARIGSPLTFYWVTWHFVPLPDGIQDMEIAVRAKTTPYLRLHRGTSDPFVGAWLAPAAVAKNVAEQARLNGLAGKDGALPSVALDLVVVFGGLAVLALFLAQRSPEYLWLSIYLVLMGLGDLSFYTAEYALLPYTVNGLFADPFVFISALIQIEFTFAFARHRPNRMWRIFEVLLVLMTIVGYFRNTFGLLPVAYDAVQAAMLLVVSLAIPILLLVWFRRGNREAGWLILPSFLNLPGAILDATFVTTNLHSTRLHFLQSLTSIPVGSFRFETTSLMLFLYLIAIGIVLFFRYTRVTREQTRATAELEAAREIQSRLIPLNLPEIEGFHVTAAFVPAAEVGGDFFQVLRHEDGSTLIAVGDVSGKGLRAAMTGTLAIGALRTLADEGMPPAQLLAALNRQLFRSSQGGFVTLLCARLALDGTLTFANAGHLFPYRNGEETPIDTGVPLGITADAAYAETSFQLQPGDRITLLSDGVVEARKADGELFGFARAETLSAHPPEHIAQAAQTFGQEDDITVLSLSFVPATA